MSERQWHYAQDNQATGPIPESQLQQMFGSGALPRQTLVWTAGMAQWTPADTVDAFRTPPSAPLAPSELVLLNGEQFGSKALIPTHNVELPHTDVKVNGADVAKAMLSAAFLACEQGGAVRLVTQPRKAMMGMRTEVDLFAEPGPSSPNAWPEGSYEWQIGRIVATHGRTQISGIIHTMLQKTTHDADRQCVDLAKEVLHMRGLLTKEQAKAALFFTVNRFGLAPGAAPLLQQHSVLPVRQMLDATRSGRPELWAALNREIVAGSNSRTQSSD